MDLDARYFLENIRVLYHDCALATGSLTFSDRIIEPHAIQRTRLMTIEGEWDDIAAPGQTSAAHRLCTSLPNLSRRHVVVPGCGHFSLFHGQTWRSQVLQEILAFAGVDRIADVNP
jgi:poly(3-hydroxybutyrate) depolymerase